MRILKRILVLLLLLIITFLIYSSNLKSTFLTSKTFFMNDIFFQSEGTWKAKNFNQGVYNVSNIQCYKQKKECIIASTDIDLSIQMRPVYINIYTIQKWNDNEIIAYTDMLKFPQKLIINKELHIVKTIMNLDNNENRVMTLESGTMLHYNAWNAQYTVQWRDTHD